MISVSNVFVCYDRLRLGGGILDFDDHRRRLGLHNQADRAVGMHHGVCDNLAGQEFSSLSQIRQTPRLHGGNDEGPSLPWCQAVWPTIHFDAV
jgi:hypothetical protein